jgi:hypothetical protein
VPPAFSQGLDVKQDAGLAALGDGYSKRHELLFTDAKHAALLDGLGQLTKAVGRARYGLVERAQFATL